MSPALSPQLLAHAYTMLQTDADACRRKQLMGQLAGSGLLEELAEGSLALLQVPPHAGAAAAAFEQQDLSEPSSVVVATASTAANTISTQLLYW
jgi:hypothetical protein